jgi:hypothetical protein
MPAGIGAQRCARAVNREDSMRTVLRWVGSLLLAFAAAASPVQAALVADSVLEFSGTQGADGWSYGYFNRTALGAYSTGGFSAFALYDAGTARWQASEAQVGAANNVYLGTDRFGGHPNGLGPDAQDANIWAMRRWVSDIDGPVRLDFDLRKLNTNPASGGITGHLFVDGVEVFSSFIAAADGVGIQSFLMLDISIGTLIDFAIDPTGVLVPGRGDGIESARADGSQFSASISTVDVPEPAALALVLVGLCGLSAARRSLRR